MPRLEFSGLRELYRHIVFDEQGGEGLLSIATEDMLATLKMIEADDDAADDANLEVLTAPRTLAVGKEVRVRVSAPRLGLGIFARDFDRLLDAPQARIREPKAYFIVEGRLERDAPEPPRRLLAYRAALRLVALFAEAASYLDAARAELVFIREGKFAVPIRYGAAELDRLALAAVKRLEDHFADETHKDQKLEILAEAIFRICQAQPPDRRFVFLLENVETLADEVRDGYRLFASNFSYGKIRSELENARIEYVTKIHRTVVDIQGQLLGIPLATVIVASQLKVATACSLELWADVAVVGGVWIFVILLLIAIANQWLTLGTIGREIDRQKTALLRDYAAISVRFSDVFTSLGRRIVWHRFGLAVVAAIAIAGALFASLAFANIVQVDVSDCLSGQLPLTVRNSS